MSENLRLLACNDRFSTVKQKSLLFTGMFRLLLKNGDLCNSGLHSSELSKVQNVKKPVLHTNVTYK